MTPCPRRHRVSHADFRRFLLTEHAYQTPAADGPVRSAAFPSLRYHGAVLGQVLRSGRLAQRGRYDRTAWEAACFNILSFVEAIGGRMAIEGLANLAGLNRPFVVAANHMSSLETQALACIIQPFHNVTFVIKQSLLSYPFFGDILRSLDPIAVTRSDARADLRTLLTEGAQRLEAGLSMIIFPQARRRAVFDPAEFNSIACKLAARTGAPLVPLALKTDFLTRGVLLADYGRVHPDRAVRFSFGPAIAARGRERDAHRETLAFVSGRLRDWGAAMKAATDPAPPGGEERQIF